MLGFKGDTVVFFDNRHELRYYYINHDSLLIRELGLGFKRDGSPTWSRFLFPALARAGK